jgi:phosphoribosylformylglycinamidine synthase II
MSATNWVVEIYPLEDDPERQRVVGLVEWLTHRPDAANAVAATAHGYILSGDWQRAQVELLCDELLVDRLVEEHAILPLAEFGPLHRPEQGQAHLATVLYKPGVMDPVVQSVTQVCAQLRLPPVSVQRFRRYYGPGDLPAATQQALWRVIANDAIERIITGPLTPGLLALGTPYRFERITVPLRGLSPEQLDELSQTGQLALDRAEMLAIQAHYDALGREPTDIELETIAQTWSEHCSHKTLKGAVTLTDAATGRSRSYRNLLKETIFAATEQIRARLGAADWCVSVFADNAGVVRFDQHYHLCFKVETHNHPSAIEPYGGANTGLGGVIRDILGTGRGAKPICNTNVFCFAPPDMPSDALPPGVLPPRLISDGVVAGVRDYGNRMGIPTVNGAVIYDPRYLTNPLVYCGTVGLLPVQCVEKSPRPGDWIVVIGGRTGRDGIHGATFSSLELAAASETLSGGAVQIGNAITQKKLADVLLQARDRGLYRALTDCGAGGFSSAIGEMAADCGAEVHLHQAPLKYTGLSYTEIWISESQERMILAVPPEQWSALRELCDSEDVEVSQLGTFTADGRLRLYYDGQLVGDLDLRFLHAGRPPRHAQASVPPPAAASAASAASAAPAAAAPAVAAIAPPARTPDLGEVLLRILATPTVASKEWIIRQYDHEVQGGSVLKPLVGTRDHGPGDAAVIAPILGQPHGFAVGCGINPRYGDYDAYAMAAAAIDEAVRNVVAVGADPARVALLDNFSWGNVRDPLGLGALVRAAEACRDVALAFGTPFISGKDSLNNEYRDGARRVSIPGTLLISALGLVPDVRQCVSMDLKAAGHRLYLVGHCRDERAGSHYQLVTGEAHAAVPTVDLASAPAIFAAVHAAIRAGAVRACHDLSEGGLAVALAESAFAGEVGVEVRCPAGWSPPAWLFSESPTRFLLEVEPQHVPTVETLFAGLPCVAIGQTVAEPVVHITDAAGATVLRLPTAELERAWRTRTVPTSPAAGA